MIRENMLIQWHDTPTNPFIERVLYVDPTVMNIVVFNIYDKHALPVWRSYAEVTAALQTDQAHVLRLDPYERLIRDEADIPEKHRKRRDAAWQAIKNLVLDEDGNTRVAFFDSQQRGQLLAAVAKDGYKPDPADAPSYHKKSLYDWCRRWWRGGMRKNALLPSWNLCGSHFAIIGRRRTVQHKLGCPSKESKIQGTPIGVNVDNHTQDLLLQGYRRFFDPKKRHPWEYAYLQTMAVFYTDGHERRSNGCLIPILKPDSERPTKKQFKYCAQKARDADYVNELKRLLGRGAFNRKHRALLGNSTQQAFGPMSMYQIDAWLADIYLVSALNRNWIIGRPVVYIVKDVFSRLIVGFSANLEGPSWTGATLALQNVVEDKVVFCAEFEVVITPEMWPTASLPRIILADRGEFEGYNASTLDNAFRIRISNTAPYRGDLKAIIERDFLLIKDRTVQLLPGHVYKLRDREEKDYRLEACLTLDEFRQIMIRHIIYHNNCWRMNWYRLDEFAIQDEIQPYPIRLWNWGLENRSGSLREQLSPERVRLGLLPRGTASSTPSGLLFEKLHYHIDFPDDEWGHQAEKIYVRARIEGRERFIVAYDERSLKTIYLSIDDGHRLVPCHISLSETSFQGGDFDLYDARYYFALKERNAGKAKSTDQQALVEFWADNQATVERARVLTEAARGDQSRKARLDGIREHRQYERQTERNRAEQRHELLQEPTPTTVRQKLATPQPHSGKSDYIAPPQPFELFEELLQEEGN